MTAEKFYDVLREKVIKKHGVRAWIELVLNDTWLFEFAKYYAKDQNKQIIELLSEWSRAEQSDSLGEVNRIDLLSRTETLIEELNEYVWSKKTNR